MGSLSLTHILILVVILLIFFGPNRLPALGQSLGKAIKGFKDGLNNPDGDNDHKSQLNENNDIIKQANRDKTENKS